MWRGGQFQQLHCIEVNFNICKKIENMYGHRKYSAMGCINVSFIPAEVVTTLFDGDWLGKC